MITILTAAIFLSFFASAILVNYCLGRILNLSLSSIFTLGAYILLYTGQQSLALPAAFLAGFTLGAVLATITQKLSVGEGTIVSLGIAIAVEEALRMTFRTSYYQTVETQYVTLLSSTIDIYEIYASLLSAVLLILLAVAFTSSYGIKLRFIEDDYELAEIYGANTKKIRLLSISITSGFICVSGAILAPTYAIFPSMGWNVLAVSVITASLATWTGNAGLRKYIITLPIALLYTSLIYVLRWYA
ncbi:ABC transporter permease subunit [Geoglobus acetivorans]|uniref:Uncharacterized protein n=1 Tax=Geoglobus acetivorans TaxID=565033 RepID=A0ABZ3H3S9_GEOAI|nr:hypothetical protein [Geoglobus acetivorans]